MIVWDFERFMFLVPCSSFRVAYSLIVSYKIILILAFAVKTVLIVSKMIIKRFEDLVIWQEARELCKCVFKVTSIEPFCNDFKFRDQIRASSGSVMDNIGEGFDRGGNKEFSQFLSISRGSCGEVRSQSYRAFDWKYISEYQLNELLERTDKLSRKISNLMQHLKASPLKGTKYI
jgi:four helix bundle protein